MTGYYDYVLAAIPVALFGITAAFVLTGFSLTMAVPAGASVSMAVIGHAMFVRAPVDSVPGEEVAAADAPQPNAALQQAD